MPDESINILLFLTNGFEDLEAIAIREVFGRTQYSNNIKKAFISTTAFHPAIKSRFGRIISCSGPGSAVDVAFLLMEHLLGLKTTQKVRKFMIYKNS